MGVSIESQLQQLGLKENEVSVYLAVLELGEPAVGEVAQKTTLHKQLIYNAAETLQARGVLSILELRGRKRFRVDDPSALEQMIENSLISAKKLTPLLYSRANTKRTKDKMRTFRGAKAIHNYYANAVRKQPEGSTVQIVGMNSARYFELFPQDQPPYQLFERARVARKVRLQLLLFGDQKQEAKLNAHRKYLSTRISVDQIQSPMDIMIWQDHVGMLFYGDDPYVLDIIGSETVEGYNAYFRVLWNQAE